MSAEEYIGLDEQVAAEKLLTDKVIVSMVRPNTRDSDDRSNDSLNLLPHCMSQERKLLLGWKKVLLYMEQRGLIRE